MYTPVSVEHYHRERTQVWAVCQSRREETTPPAEQMFRPVAMACRKRGWAHLRWDKWRQQMWTWSLSPSFHWWLQEPIYQRWWRTLVLGWWCIQIIQSQTHSAPNLLRCAEIYHATDVGGLFFSRWNTQVQVLGDAVYNCDNDKKQLVQVSFPTTSTHLKCNLWINLSHVVRYGLLGQFSKRRPPPLLLLSAKYAPLMQGSLENLPWQCGGDSLGKHTKTLTLSLIYSSLVAVDITASSHETLQVCDKTKTE